MGPVTLGLLVAVLPSLACAAPTRFQVIYDSPPHFLDELKKSLSPDHELPSEQQVRELAEALSSTFAPLPKDRRGAVSAPLARSMAHRFLVQRHGWSVRGLAPASDFQHFQHVLRLGDPGQPRSQFRVAVGGGLDLNEVAALTAAIENLIHAEAVGQLRATYALFER